VVELAEEICMFLSDFCWHWLLTDFVC
jgi:hypothetical protein